MSIGHVHPRRLVQQRHAPDGPARPGTVARVLGGLGIALGLIGMAAAVLGLAALLTLLVWLVAG